LIERAAPVFRFTIANLSRTHQRKVKKSRWASNQQGVAVGRDRPVNDRASANERRLRVTDTRFQGPIDGLEGSRQTRFHAPYVTDVIELRSELFLPARATKQFSRVMKPFPALAQTPGNSAWLSV
jgi:hypothetical protein